MIGRRTAKCSAQFTVAFHAGKRCGFDHTDIAKLVRRFKQENDLTNFVALRTIGIENLQGDIDIFVEHEPAGTVVKAANLIVAGLGGCDAPSRQDGDSKCGKGSAKAVQTHDRLPFRSPIPAN